MAAPEPREVAGVGRRRRWTVALRVATAVVLLALLAAYLARRGMPPLPEPRRTAAGIAGAALLLPPILLLRALKWREVLRLDLPGVSVGAALRSYVGAMPLGVITPGRVGELARLAFLPPIPGGALRGASLVALDRLIDLLTILWPAAVGFWLLLGRWAGLGCLAVAASGLALASWLRAWSAFVARAPASWRLHGLAFPQEHFPPGKVFRLMGLGTGAHLLVALQYVLVIGALTEAPFPRLAVMGIMSVVTLVGTLPVSIGGLGVREGGAALLLAAHEVPAAVAGVGAFLAFLVNEVTLSLVGLLVPARREAR